MNLTPKARHLKMLNKMNQFYYLSDTRRLFFSLTHCCPMQSNPLLF